MRTSAPGKWEAASLRLVFCALTLVAHKPQLACNLLRSYDVVIRAIPAKFLSAADRSQLLAEAARSRSVVGC